MAFIIRFLKVAINRIFEKSEEFPAEDKRKEEEETPIRQPQTSVTTSEESSGKHHPSPLRFTL